MTLTGSKYRFNRLLGILAAAVAAVALVACSSDASALRSDGDPEAGRLSFRVVIPKSTPSGMTRATWGDPYTSQEGNDFETALLVSEFWTVITNADCSEQIAVTALVCTKTADWGTARAYNFEGRVSKENLEAVQQLTNGKLHIVANAGERPSLTDNMAFTRWGQPSKDFAAIPMWGVKTVDFSPLAPNATLDLGEVSLLRAMAKVEIENAQDEDNDFAELKSVKINTVNTSGYLLPAGWAGVGDTKMQERNALHIPEQTPLGPQSFGFTGNKVAFYLPEMLNTGNADEIKMTLDYRTKRNEEGSCDIYFCKYGADGAPTGDRLDLRRNYLYRFTVKGDFHEILFEVTVDPWVFGGRTEIEM